MNSTFTVGLIGLSGGISKFHDNVKQLDLIPTVDNLSYSSGLSITPPSRTGWNSPLAFPWLTASGSHQESTGEAVSFLAVDSIVDTFSAVSRLIRLKWNLTVNGTYAVNRDRTNRVADSETKILSLAAPFYPHLP